MHGACPRCGYCPHCGRSNLSPWYPYGYWPPYPRPYTYPQWSSGTSVPHVGSSIGPVTLQNPKATWSAA